MVLGSNPEEEHQIPGYAAAQLWLFLWSQWHGLRRRRLAVFIRLCSRRRTTVHCLRALSLTLISRFSFRSYTGFLPGSQHQMAKTYGQASAATLKERQANQDPLKWRKHVSYAEFTPAHTPAEGHHIPGYSGHVPGVYAENLYAKTYGKTTLQAVSGDFAKGCVQDSVEQYKTNTMILYPNNIPHPGRPTDIAPGGASWSGASPYNVEIPAEMEPTNPWPPSVVQIAGGKEPTQTSIILKNFPTTGESKEPALRITPKDNPHDATDPHKKTMTVTEGYFKIPGYSGFVPGVQAENLFAQTYARTTASANGIRDRKDESFVNLKTSGIGEDGVLPLEPPKPPAMRSGEMLTTQVDGPNTFVKHIPGYTGFVPGVSSESMYGNTYGHASMMSIAGDHKRFQWREQEPEDRFASSTKGDFMEYGHAAKIEDGHITYAHDWTNPAQANYNKVKKPIFGEYKNQIPGYGGFVPGVQSKNMFGKGQFQTTTEALEGFYKQHEKYESEHPKTAPVGNPETLGLGMLQFKPNGFMYQKRMQGEWNNGMLGSRNYSAVRLSEGRHWGKDVLYKTTSKELMKGHTNEDVPPIYSKGPEPKFENMQHALKHKSCYLGFMAV